MKMSLSFREREVVDAIVSGLRPKEIARDLGISNRTVESHIEHARTKLGARNVMDLVRMALTEDDAGHRVDASILGPEPTRSEGHG